MPSPTGLDNRFRLYGRCTAKSPRATIWAQASISRSPYRQLDHANGGRHAPSRLEQQWRPRYNIIELEVMCVNGRRTLTAKINARVWDDNYQAFKPDVAPEEESSYEYEFGLQNWERPVVALTGKNDATAEVAKVEEAKVETTDGVEGEMQGVKKVERELLYRFLSLPYQRQQRLALELNLISEQERFPEEIDLWRAVFTRARDKGRLEEFWKAVQASSPAPQPTEEENQPDIKEH